PPACGALGRAGRPAPDPQCRAPIGLAQLRCSYSSSRSLADRQCNVLDLTASTQSKRDGLAYAVRSERAQERSHMTERFTVPANNDVALVHACLGAWSLRLHVHYHYTSSAALNGDKF